MSECRMIHASAVATPWPNGSIFDLAVIEYSSPVRNESIHPETFSAAGRTIERAYANDRPERAAEGCDGSYVILELSRRDPEAPLAYIEYYDEDGRVIPTGPDGGPVRRAGHQQGGHMGPPPMQMKRRPLKVTIRQVSAISAADGTAAPAGEIVSDQSRMPLAEEFRQFTFDGIPYNLFIPKGADSGRKFPLVQFIHDAGPCGDDPLLTLIQGNGALNFASPRDQELHPCFVLAPQVPRGEPLTRDSFQASDLLERLKRLLDHVIASYPIDTDRIYTTGQSMGCMSSCELNIRYPELFAASLLVAGQWDPQRMAALTGKNLWILVSQGDAKAFPGMNAVTAALEENGAAIGRYWWDGKASEEEHNQAVQEALADPVHIRYTVFTDSSVVPEGTPANPGSNHMSTWPVVYSISALRDWLLSQSL